jgi:hypothetical protein
MRDWLKFKILAASRSGEKKCRGLAALAIAMALALLGFPADLSNLRAANRNPLAPRRREAHSGQLLADDAVRRS